MIMSLVTGVKKNWAANLDMTNWTEQQINSTIVMNPGIVALLVVEHAAADYFHESYHRNPERKVPVQYAKRVVGRKMYGGQSTHIPIKVNLSGVLPIIFAQSIAMIPATIGMFVPPPPPQQEGSAWHLPFGVQLHQCPVRGDLLPADHHVQLLLCYHPV